MASLRNGTAITEATVWDRVRTSFRVVIAYFVFVGTMSCESPGNFWIIDVREIAEREPDELTSEGFSSVPFSGLANVVSGTTASGLSRFWMQLCVNEIAQHKLMLTSRSVVSLLFFFAPHGMCRRNQEKHPADIVVVRRQLKEQGVIGFFQGAVIVRLRPAIYKVGIWDTCRKPCGGPRWITPYRGSVSKVRYRTWRNYSACLAHAWVSVDRSSVLYSWFPNEIWQYGEKFRHCHCH